MKYAIIDIGSNSVRMAIFADGNIILRDKITSVLGEGIANCGRLNKEAIERNAKVVESFYLTAIGHGVEPSNVLPFATAAVRQTSNGEDFVRAVKEKTGVSVKVLSEKDECEVALYGALGKSDGAVLDVGGASSELIVRKNGQIVFEKSLPEGAVKLSDEFSEDESALKEYLEKLVRSYGAPKIEKITAIGGSATCLSYVLSGDKMYDREKNHNRFVSITDLYDGLCKIKSVPIENRSRYYVIEESRAKSIYYGGMLIYSILNYLGLNGYTVSENDNLEGYYFIGGNL